MFDPKLCMCIFAGTFF